MPVIMKSYKLPFYLILITNLLLFVLGKEESNNLSIEATSHSQNSGITKKTTSVGNYAIKVSSTPTTPKPIVTTRAHSPNENKCNISVKAIPSTAEIILPSGQAQIRSNTTCTTVAQCPDFVVSDESKDMVIPLKKRQENDNNTCYVDYSIRPSLQNFKSRRVQGRVYFQLGNMTSEAVLFTFTKSGNQGKCLEDIDCWSENQACFSEKCACFPETPVYLVARDRCFPVAKYGERCDESEQCTFADKNSMCESHICRCQNGFWTTSATDVTCTNNSPSGMLSNNVATFLAINFVFQVISRLTVG